MENIHFHVDETEWQTLPEQAWRAYLFKELLNRHKGGSREYIFGFAEVAGGGKLPPHTHRHELALHFLSGKAKVRLGKQTVELESNSGAFFPANKPHSIEALGSEPLQ